MKRADVLSWDEYFMSMAHLSAKRSKDPSTQVGACIVNSQKELSVLDTMVFLKDAMIMNSHGIEMANF